MKMNNFLIQNQTSSCFVLLVYCFLVDLHESKFSLCKYIRIATYAWLCHYETVYCICLGILSFKYNRFHNCKAIYVASYVWVIAKFLVTIQ